MADDANILDLFSGDPALAKSQAALLAQAIRSRRAAGTLGTLTGDSAMGAVGKEMTGDADKMEQTLVGAAQHRAQFAPQMQEREELNAARKSPGYVKALRDTLGNYGLQVDEGTPVQALERLLPTQEKFAQANILGQFRGALQNRLTQKQDPNSGETYLLRPLDGATFHMDGSPRTAGVPGAGGFRGLNLGGADGPQPQTPPQVPPKAPPKQPKAAAATPTPDAAPDGAPQTLADYAAPSVLPASKLFPVIQREAAQFRKQLNPTSTSSGAIRQQNDKVIAANVLETLMTDAKGNFVNLNPSQQREAYTSLAKLVGAGGGMSEGQVNELDSPTLARDFAKGMQYFTGKPYAVDTPGMFQLILDTTHREKEQSQSVMRKAIADEVSQFPNVVKYQPKIVEAMVSPLGMTLKDFDRNGRYVGAAIGQTPKERAGSGDRPPVAGAFKTKSGRWAVKNADGKSEYVE